MTNPRYVFTACSTDYEGMDAESKEMFHQLVNAAGDRATQDAEIWTRELLAAGWKEHHGIRTTWEAPNGALYRDPYGAWRTMKAGQ